MRPSRTAALLFVTGSLAAAGGSACGPTDPCPPYDAIEHARAVDATHVEVVLRCPVTGASASTVSVAGFAASDEAALTVRKVSGDRKLLVETDPQQGLATYTVRLDGVKGPGDASITASANFVGVGDLDTAPVTLRVDDCYGESLERVWAQVTFDPETGVFTHYTSEIELLDDDGDHVFEAPAEDRHRRAPYREHRRRPPGPRAPGLWRQGRRRRGRAAVQARHLRDRHRRRLGGGHAAPLGAQACPAPRGSSTCT